MAIYDVNGNEIASGGGSGFPGLPLSPVLGTNFLIRHYGGNSHANFVAAVNNGYVATEGDVRFTSDEIPVMAHDSSVGGLSIATHTLAELEAVATIYKLDDWLLDCKKFNVFADVDFTKTYTNRQCEILVAHLGNMGMTGRASIECGISYATVLVQYSKNLLLNLLSATSEANINRFAAVEDSCKGIICTTAVESVNPSIVEFIHKKGYISKVWNSSDSVASTTNYLNMGVDQVIVDTTKPSNITPA